MKTFFNIIIPTRERADTLKYALETVLMQDYDQLRIVVCDNCSRDHTRELVEAIDDQRVHYLRAPRRLSMSHNWEFALSQIESGWVMYVGDDDGLLPNALSYLDEQIRKHKVQALTSDYCIFRWPNHFDEDPEGELLVPIADGATVKDCELELNRAFAGKQSYIKLPWLYTGGAADMEVIRRCMDNQGRFFRSQIPDLYSAVSLCSVNQRYLSVNRPVSIHGASRHSTGYSNLSSEKDSQSEPIKAFLSEENIPFHPSLVLGRSVYMMLYECYLQSWHLHGGRFGYRLKDCLKTAVSVAHHSRRRDVILEVNETARKNGINFYVDPDKVPWHMRIPSLSHAQDIFRREGTPPLSIGVENVYQASLACGEILEDALSKPDRGSAKRGLDFARICARKVASALR